MIRVATSAPRANYRDFAQSFDVTLARISRRRLGTWCHVWSLHREAACQGVVVHSLQAQTKQLFVFQMSVLQRPSCRARFVRSVFHRRRRTAASPNPLSGSQLQSELRPCSVNGPCHHVGCGQRTRVRDSDTKLMAVASHRPRQDANQRHEIMCGLVCEIMCGLVCVDLLRDFKRTLHGGRTRCRMPFVLLAA